jgi:hypothetical protein
MRPLSNVPGLTDQLVVSQEDSARKLGNVGGKVPEFLAQSYFVGLFRARGRRSSRCRISVILTSLESLCYLLSKGTGLA